MKFTRLLLSCIFIFVMILPSSINVYAYNKVTANATVDGCRLIIDGKISGINESVEVLLIVGEDVMPLYLDKNFSTSKGEFYFNIFLPEDLERGEYRYRLGFGAINPYEVTVDFYTTR